MPAPAPSPGPKPQPHLTMALRQIPHLISFDSTSFNMCPLTLDSFRNVTAIPLPPPTTCGLSGMFPDAEALPRTPRVSFPALRPPGKAAVQGAGCLSASPDSGSRWLNPSAVLPCLELVGTGFVVGDISGLVSLVRGQLERPRPLSRVQGRWQAGDFILLHKGQFYRKRSGKGLPPAPHSAASQVPLQHPVRLPQISLTESSARPRRQLACPFPAKQIGSRQTRGSAACEAHSQL